MAPRFTLPPPASPRATSLGAALRIDVSDPLTANYAPPELDLECDGVELDAATEEWLEKARAKEIYAHVRNSGFSRQRRLSRNSRREELQAPCRSEVDEQPAPTRRQEELRPVDFAQIAERRISGEQPRVRPADFAEVARKPARMRKCGNGDAVRVDEWAPPTERDPRSRRRDW